MAVPSHALPTPPEFPWTSASSPQHSIHPVPLSVFEALASGDLERASSLSPASLPPLTPFLITADNRKRWRRRLDEITADPEQTPWMARLIVYDDTGTQDQDSDTPDGSRIIVGRIGFHGTPEEGGVVEIGYEIDTIHQRRGHVTAAVRIMVDVARAMQGVNVLRARVVEKNLASSRVVLGQGLQKIGQQMHEWRGMVNIYELDVSN